MVYLSPPLGGAGELFSGHKGYGLALLVELNRHKTTVNVDQIDSLKG